MKSKKVASSAAKKKPVAKTVAKKPVAKPLPKKAVKVTSTKPSPKSPAVKKAVVKTVKQPAKKPSTGFSLKAAASKLKNALSKASPAAAPKSAKSAPVAPVKTVTKSVPSSAAAKTPPAKSPVAGGKKPTGSSTASKSPYVSPKGVLTEEQVRKMSDKDYMSDAQLEFFRHRLLQMRNEVLERELDVKERLHQREVFADPADRATAEEEHWLDLRLRERESLLLHKIDDALRRIADKEYGYCEKTGDPIGIPRLLARPTATVCVDVKGQDERIESQFRDR